MFVVLVKHLFLFLSLTIIILAWKLTVGIHSRLCQKPISIDTVQQALENFYQGSPIITVVPLLRTVITGMLNAIN